MSTALALGNLGKKSIATVTPLLVEWMEQNPDAKGIGKAIDALWSIVVE